MRRYAKGNKPLLNCYLKMLVVMFAIQNVVSYGRDFMIGSLFRSFLAFWGSISCAALNPIIALGLAAAGGGLKYAAVPWASIQWIWLGWTHGIWTGPGLLVSPPVQCYIQRLFWFVSPCFPSCRKLLWHVAITRVWSDFWPIFCSPLHFLGCETMWVAKPLKPFK